MTVFQMQCFVTAAREQNFSRAAQLLFISQPALSRHIGNLENELQIRLFERTLNHRIRLTEAGTAYFDLYSRFLQEAGRLSEKYKMLQSDPFGKFSFGYLAGWDVSFFLPELLDKFEKGHPGVVVNMVSLPHNELFSALERGELDVVLAPKDYIPNSDRVEWEHVADINYVLLFADRFMVKYPELKTIKDLRHSTFYMTADSLLAQRKEISERFTAELGFAPKISTLPNADTVMAYVKGGMGVTLTDSWGRYVNAESFHKRELTSKRGIVLAWPAKIAHKLPHQIVRELKEVLNISNDWQ